MTKRYARIAGSQAREAVKGLDSILRAAEEGENSDTNHYLVYSKPRG
jgi:hypothetical protein